MKQTIGLWEFRDAFRQADRMENFSHEGLELLFDYLEELEQDTGEEMELDVVAICCDFSEEAPEDIAEAYNIDIEECQGDEEEIKRVVLEYLEENTTVVGQTYSTIVYQSF